MIRVARVVDKIDEGELYPDPFLRVGTEQVLAGPGVGRIGLGIQRRGERPGLGRLAPERDVTAFTSCG